MYIITQIPVVAATAISSAMVAVMGTASAAAAHCIVSPAITATHWRHAGGWWKKVLRAVAHVTSPVVSHFGQ